MNKKAAHIEIYHDDSGFVQSLLVDGKELGYCCTRADVSFGGGNTHEVKLTLKGSVVFGHFEHGDADD